MISRATKKLVEESTMITIASPTLAYYIAICFVTNQFSCTSTNILMTVITTIHKRYNTLNFL
jgi:hypothetical protein